MISKPQSEPEEPDKTIPPLENGDFLTRAEFERRYEAMPHVKKAELIEGVVYMPSPVSLRKHSAPHFNMNTWLGLYVLETPGVIGGDNGTVRLDLDNEPQPDAFLIIEPDFGGQAQIDEDDYVSGAPELVVEVSSSTVSIDLHRKLNSYRRNGVLEYIVWRVQDKTIDWFALQEGKYERLSPDDQGVIHSVVFPGLALDAEALISGDKRRMATVQREALRSPKHAEFVQKLARAGAIAE
jgi:Uma2 family endonuclease